jgi:hypothetical protein
MELIWYNILTPDASRRARVHPARKIVKGRLPLAQWPRLHTWTQAAWLSTETAPNKKHTKPWWHHSLVLAEESVDDDELGVLMHVQGSQTITLPNALNADKQKESTSFLADQYALSHGFGVVKSLMRPMPWANVSH